MELGEREIKQIVRVIMPELYRWQAAWDEWTDAAARLSVSQGGQTEQQELPDDRSETVH